MSCAGSIPRVIHQTWRDAALPADFERYARTWRTLHPRWDYRLWTDADNRQLIARDYAWFLPLYDAYPEAIMRADAARYFVLHRFGGLYADLDFECLRPFDALLEGKEIVLGAEPEAHTRLPLARERALDVIVSNALMACVPRHPFFERLVRLLPVSARAPGPLDATGPFLLTRAWQACTGRERIELLAPELIYPVTSGESAAGVLNEPAGRARMLADAYAVHHWAGTWWRKTREQGVFVGWVERSATHQPAALQSPQRGDAPAADDDALPVRLLDRGRLLAVADVETEVACDGLRSLARSPLVSALMVTRGRPVLAARAIACFTRQTYGNVELVIVDDDEDDELARHVQSLADPRIRHLRLESRGAALGVLRNVALENASGDYVCQWDDDDLSDPRRIELELAAILAMGAQACFLQREQLLCVAHRVFARSGRRLWEGSFLCERARVPRYPETRRGEDTPVSVSILRANRIVVLDRPDLYTYVHHGLNTFGAEHFERLLSAATEIFEHEAYPRMARELAKRAGLALSDVGLPEDDAAAAAPRSLAQPPGAHGNQSRAGETPPIALLCPVKDAVPFLPRFVANLRALTYDHRRISVAFLESDSRDATAANLERELPALEREFRRAELYRRDFGFRTVSPRWEPAIQRERRATLARSRNYLLSRALRDEVWVLWMDVDVTAYPADLIEQLLAAGREIVAPHCVTRPGGPTFDLNTFRLTPDAAGRDWTPYVVDGLLQPPRGAGRTYLESWRDHEIVEVDSVGGAALLVKADLHREGLVFPAAPYRLHIETEGLALLARDMGYRCYALPRVEIVHPPAAQRYLR